MLTQGALLHSVVRNNVIQLFVHVFFSRIDFLKGGCNFFVQLVEVHLRFTQRPFDPRLELGHLSNVAPPVLVVRLDLDLKLWQDPLVLSPPSRGIDIGFQDLCTEVVRTEPRHSLHTRVAMVLGAPPAWPL